MLPATKVSPSSAAAYISNGGRAKVKSVFFERLTRKVVLTIAVKLTFRLNIDGCGIWATLPLGRASEYAWVATWLRWRSGSSLPPCSVILT